MNSKDIVHRRLGLWAGDMVMLRNDLAFSVGEDEEIRKDNEPFTVITDAYWVNGTQCVVRLEGISGEYCVQNFIQKS